MFDFITNNLSTIVVGLILLGIIILVVKGMVKDKKMGKSSCGSGCSGCPNSGVCHKSR